MVWREKVGCRVEVISNYVPNVVSLFLTTGLRVWYVVGAYITPNNAPNVDCVEQTLGNSPKGVDFILMGDLSKRLREPHKARE